MQNNMEKKNGQNVQNLLKTVIQESKFEKGGRKC